MTQSDMDGVLIMAILMNTDTEKNRNYPRWKQAGNTGIVYQAAIDFKARFNFSSIRFL